MYRPLLTNRLHSISRSIWKSKPPDCGRRKCGDGNLVMSQDFTTLSGLSCLSREREPIIRSVRLQIINALGLGERSRASNLLSNLSCRKNSLRASDFLSILEHCARSPDPLFVMETWRIMREKEIDIDEKSYFLIIRSLCKGGYLEEAFHLINFLGENHDSYPMLPFYNNILGACVRLGSSNHANNLLDLMENQMVGKNEITYTELLKHAVLQKNLSAVHGIWIEYIKNYSLSVITLRKFVWSFARLRDLESAYEALQYMIALALRGGFIISKTAEGKLYISRLDIPIPSNIDLRLKSCSKESESYGIPITTNCEKIDTRTSNGENCIIYGRGRQEIKNKGPTMLKKNMTLVTKVLRWSFSDVIHGCAQTLNFGLAEQLIFQMQNLGLEPSSHTYDGLIRAIVSGKGFHDGLELLKVMEQRNLRPYDSTLATISIGCSKYLEINLAEALLHKISKYHCVYPYNAFLEACNELDLPERAVQMLAKMKQMKLQPDIKTYELLFSLFGNVNAPYEDGNMLSQVDVAKRIRAIELDMVKNGIEHSHLSMKNLLKALGAEGMTRELIQYLRLAENQFSHGSFRLRTPIYNTVLHSLVEAKESHLAMGIFKTMKSCGFLLDAATYNIMIDSCSIIRCFKTACALVSMMVRDGFYPQAVSYTALIKILLGYEDFDEALKLLEQGCLEGIQLDVLLFNTILQEACEKGRIDIIELILERMHREKIQPDSSTCSFVFSAYVDSGFISTAMEALQVLSMRMVSEEAIVLEELRNKYEESFILADDLEVESQMAKFFKESNEKLAVALLNLRWCAVNGFPISWSSAQSPWARRLSGTFASRTVT